MRFVQPTLSRNAQPSVILSHMPGIARGSRRFFYNIRSAHCDVPSHQPGSKARIPRQNYAPRRTLLPSLLHSPPFSWKMERQQWNCQEGKQQFGKRGKAGFQGPQRTMLPTLTVPFVGSYSFDTSNGGINNRPEGPRERRIHSADTNCPSKKPLYTLCCSGRSV